MVNSGSPPQPDPPQPDPPQPDPPQPGRARRAASRFWRMLLRQLEIAALGVAAAGWLAAVLTRCLALWTVSGTLDNQMASLPAYWDGVWLQWDHWDLAHDGSLHCSFYQSLLSLSGSFRAWRALIMAAIAVGGFALLVGGAGLVWFPQRGQIKVFSGSFFVLAAILLVIPTAWTCHHTSQPLEGAVPLSRAWGPALYLGWISFGLMLLGGGFLISRCPGAKGQVGQPGGGRSPEEEASSPLSTINRTAFTNSQYNRRSPPI
ncbi:claudin-4-like [Poeciliopsis prolifica]|uniref:claudin-4-like n=1 Tax=Poeciliopsis prolifica TaxID=188132 RepID=UPI002413C4CE|nr:claudin-4-like [Poeciliopsis prolifica]